MMCKIASGLGGGVEVPSKSLCQDREGVRRYFQ